MRVELEYGDGVIAAELPDDSVVVTPESATHEPDPLADPVEATRAALARPLGSPRVAELVRPGATVTIAFPDRVKGGTQATAHRKVAIAALLDELEHAGVRPRDIRLVCAIGLHRKNYQAEFLDYLGAEVVSRVPASNLVNHDAEDPNGMADLGLSEIGDPVQVNRSVLDSDLSILIGHTAGNPYGGFSGGYKMPSTGLTSWRSIASHHSPSTMYRDDFVPVSTTSHFRSQLRSIGQRIEAAMPQPFFSVDAVLDSRSRQLGVFAGAIPDVEQASWPLAGTRTELAVPGPPADVLVIGMPRSFHYGPGMGSNPILMMQAIGSSVVRAKRALVERPIVIAASICDGWFNGTDFPPYEEAYRLLQSCHEPAQMQQFEEQLSTDPEWIQRYRFQYGYHPFHAFSMIYMGGEAMQHSSAVFVAGAREPGLARGMGARTTATVEDALDQAQGLLGRPARVLVVPRLSSPAFHLAATERESTV